MDRDQSAPIASCSGPPHHDCRQFRLRLGAGAFVRRVLPGGRHRQCGGQGRPAVVKEAVDPNREVTIEFVASPASVGSYEFRPEVASMRIHPGKLYETEFYAKNLTSVASVAQAVPSFPRQRRAVLPQDRMFLLQPAKIRRRRRPRHAGALHRGPAVAGQRRPASHWPIPSTIRRKAQHGPELTRFKLAVVPPIRD